MRSGGIWRWLSARAWSRKNLRRFKPLVERRPSSAVCRAGTPGAPSTKFSEQQCCSKKDLVVVKLGVARSEIRALSGAGMEGLVALETWQSGGENRKSYMKRRDSHGGSTAVGGVDCWPVVAGSGRTGEETGIASGRFGGGSGPGDGCRRRSVGRGSPG